MPRWLKVTVALVITVGVLAGLGEWGLRLAVPAVVQGAVRDKLDLPRNHPVDVQLGGSALLNAIRGGVGDIEVDIPNAPVADGVRATLTFEADRVPFGVTSGEMAGATAQIFVTAEDLGPVISMLTNGVVDSGKTSSGELVVGRQLEALGFTVPIEATLGLSAVDGEVLVEPRGLSAVGFDLSVDQLAAATGGMLEPLLSARQVCVSQWLPVGATLTDIKITASGARVEFALAPDLLSDSTQQALGTCE
ncbi:LmeA family phospholipid-binding protein [Leucobacter albus]|uniref:LmeA family phospholipid-binding protein n=1 Tax=Leucobacter albus TaxID=272210 RepID=A0ABW3TPT9_9MICO